MKLHSVAIAVLILTAIANGKAASIGHDEVKPFPQPEPVTLSEKAAVTFKPQLLITNGCHSYPAVNEAGETSGGLSPTGGTSAKCGGSAFGSQVYGRSKWYNDIWAIMYSWYFPKDSPSSGLGTRHDWENVIVWIDNPAVPAPKILGISTSKEVGYYQVAPPDAGMVVGTSALVNYEAYWPATHVLRPTTPRGDFQDLIMWDQLTEAARKALSDTNFDGVSVPMNDANFEQNLQFAWPFPKKI